MMSATNGGLEYIERYEVLNIINNAIDHNALSYEGCVNEIIESIAKKTAADVRPVVQGKWFRTSAFPHHIYCSVCHKTYIPNDRWQIWVDGDLPRDFCPNCGARMVKSDV